MAEPIQHQSLSGITCPECKADLVAEFFVYYEAEAIAGHEVIVKVVASPVSLKGCSHAESR